MERLNLESQFRESVMAVPMFKVHLFAILEHKAVQQNANCSPFMLQRIKVFLMVERRG